MDTQEFPNDGIMAPFCFITSIGESNFESSMETFKPASGHCISQFVCLGLSVCVKVPHLDRQEMSEKVVR